MQNRRDWLKAALTLSAGLPIGTALAGQLMRTPVSEAERNFYATNPGPFKIRLDSNENPYGPSEKARLAVQQILSEGNRYPDAPLDELKETIAKYEGVTADHIAMGAGSSEMLCTSGMAFGLEGGRILSAFPAFPLLMTYSQIFNAQWDKVNVNEKLEHDYDAIASQIKEDTRLIFICNPNNPTGTLVDPNRVKAFCEEVGKKVTVYVDEAYLEFLDPSLQMSMVELVKRGENVVVSRTFSKIYGLAGLRMGYVVAKPDLIKKISKYQMRFLASQTAIAAAKASLGDQAFMKMTRDKNAEARKFTINYLEKRGYNYGKCHTNFVFFDPKEGNAQKILTGLADRGILTRVWDFDNKQWCRVSIGTLDEMKTFVKAFEEVSA